MKKKTILIALLIALAALNSILLGYWAYSHFLVPTRIALVHFPSYQVSNFILANKSKQIKVEEVKPESASSLTGYDAILVFGPGFRPSEAQSKALSKAEEKGIAVHSFVFKSASIAGKNLSQEQEERLELYYANRTRSNFSNMLQYIRQKFDGKKLFLSEVKEPKIIPSDIYYHLDEEKYFHSANELTEELKKLGLYHEDAPRIALLSGTISPLEGNRADIDSLIARFTHAGYNVYPISAAARRLELIQEVDPDAVIYSPMGRLSGDETVAWLKEKDIPLFCPIPIGKSQDEWIADPHGLTAGALTARIVLPEIDGAILPLVISSEEEKKDKITVVQEHPERLANFVENVCRYLKLRRMPNAEKRIGIVYYRGAGQSALVASGLEVAASLYNLLKRLQSEEYNLQGLPKSFEEFNKKLQTIAANTSHSHADSAARSPKLHWIAKSTYESWAKECIRPERYEQNCELYGEAPGTRNRGSIEGEEAIGVAELSFGNVSILAQEPPALAGDNFKIIHGADVPPPHSYIAQYLWLQKGFRADALLHFGTHGSLST